MNRFGKFLKLKSFNGFISGALSLVSLEFRSKICGNEKDDENSSYSEENYLLHLNCVRIFHLNFEINEFNYIKS